MSPPQKSGDDPSRRLWMMDQSNSAYYYACGSFLPVVGIVFAMASLFLGLRVMRRESNQPNPARSRRILAMRLSGGLLIVQATIVIAAIVRSAKV